MPPEYTPACDYCQQPSDRLIRQRRQNYGKLICHPCEAARMRAHLRSPKVRARNRANWTERYARAAAEVRQYKDRPCTIVVFHCAHSSPKQGL